MKWMLAALVMVSAMVHGCAANGDGERGPGGALADTSWVYTPSKYDARPQTLVFENREGQLGVSGYAGVNRYSGTAMMSGRRSGTLTFSPLASTKMAGSPEANVQEQTFLESLAAVNQWERDGTRLTLMTTAGRTLMFERE